MITRGAHAGALLTALALTCTLLDPASGQPAEEPRRFTMSPTDGGFVRLDTVTGEVSFCARSEGSWSCRVMSDQGRDVRRDNDRLSEENTRLKAEVQRLEEALGLGAPKPDADRRAERPGPRFELPSEADIDRAMSYLDRMLRKFREKLKELEGPERKGTKL